MAEVSLVAEVGRTTGSAAARRLRTEGKIPAVLYGHGIEPQAISVDRKALRAALAHEAGLNALFALEVDGTRHLAMAKQLQRDAMKRSVSHVDFVIVRRDEIVSVEVPVHLVGEALGVEHADGMVEQQLFQLSIHAKPADIPSSIEVDITDLTIGEAIRVSDLKLPEGVTTEVDGEEPVVLGQTTRMAVEEEAEETADDAEAASAGATTEE
ncbi:MAG: large subunit ribosomal protein [Actinomycetota bacterium]|jgi:large subunit ribosomal protein L25|nr:large subunit ribosomal protein [Actinomycetota bacterium]